MNNKHKDDPLTLASAENDSQAEQEKKPYTAPRLTIHGDVKEITQLAGGVGGDGFGESTSGGA